MRTIGLQTLVRTQNMAMGEEEFVHKVNQSCLRRKPCRKLKPPSKVISTGLPIEESSLDIAMMDHRPATDHAMIPPSFLMRRRSVKDRRSSSADSATIEKAVRILKTIRALKEVVRAERASAIPDPYTSGGKESAEVARSDTWSCVLADSATRRHFVQSLTNENHVTKNEVSFFVVVVVCLLLKSASYDHMYRNALA